MRNFSKNHKLLILSVLDFHFCALLAHFCAGARDFVGRRRSYFVYAFWGNCCFVDKVWHTLEVWDAGEVDIVELRRVRNFFCSEVELNYLYGYQCFATYSPLRFCAKIAQPLPTGDRADTKKHRALPRCGCRYQRDKKTAKYRHKYHAIFTNCTMVLPDILLCR